MSAEEKNITIILLAAGNSSRMGRSKQQMDLAGEPMLLRMCKVALKSKAGKVLVVLGSNAEENLKLLQSTHVQTINNVLWRNGIGSSIKAAIQYILKSELTDAVIIMVCDQPHVSTSLLDNLIDQFKLSQKKIIASQYDDTVGVPALFSAPLFEDLLKIEDQSGAKHIIAHLKDQVEAVPFPQGGIDLDTLQDYLRFQTVNRP